GNEEVGAYKSIDMAEAKEIFDKGGDFIILDVRRPGEFAEGHIPGAINVANEDIGQEEIAELPDKKQTIYVYCRSGRRSKEASAKLVANGYENIVECGGFNSWTGEVEK
nr:rhodanese-like domain-containing protein [Lachnospiraceae bacterium]